MKTIAFLLSTVSLVILFGSDVIRAQEGPLDGKVFAGQSRVKHTRTVKEDELGFMNGKFFSSNYRQKGFGDAVYTARVEADKIFFETETVNPKKGKIKWRGVVDGDSIEVSYHLSKKGWLSNTEKDYLFQGTLKK